MTATETPEYRTLWLDTSNDLMDHDSRRVLGRHAQAREHARQAGTGRRRMGELAAAGAEFARAAGDWLSASACFVLAGDAGPAADCLARARALADAGRIPADRADLWAALSERDAQVRTLLATAPVNGPAAAPADVVPAPQP